MEARANCCFLSLYHQSDHRPVTHDDTKGAEQAQRRLRLGDHDMQLSLKHYYTLSVLWGSLPFRFADSDQVRTYLKDKRRYYCKAGTGDLTMPLQLARLASG